MANVEISIFGTTKKQEIEYFGSVLGPKYELIELIIRGKIEEAAEDLEERRCHGCKMYINILDL